MNANKVARRNLVAKHSKSKSGAGAHQPKTGELASRNRRKRAWKRELSREL